MIFIKRYNIRAVKISSIIAFLSPALLLFLLLSIRMTQASPNPTISHWWPISSIPVEGMQPFKGAVHELSISQYKMYWSVDGGQETEMATSYDGSPHKQALVDVSNWTWQQNDSYNVTYHATDSNGRTLASLSFVVYVLHPLLAVNTVKSAASAPLTSTVAPPQSGPTTAGSKPLVIPKLDSQLALYVDPSTAAAAQVAAWANSRPADAILLNKIAASPAAHWFGGWNTSITSDVNNYVSAAAAQNALPVLVAYNIPQRDCGGYSSGGSSANGYADWIRGFAQGIGNRPATVILEPDALAGLDCLSAADQATRISLLAQAVTTLKANPKTRVYIDAGNAAGWQMPATMAKRLNASNIAAADGFALNVSNYVRTTDTARYGTTLSALVGGKHYVIDTSRNGNGPAANNEWCNPSGRALGERPTLNPADPLADAYLWVKLPGESDGNCNGGPSAGTFWPDYALGLAQLVSY